MIRVPIRDGEDVGKALRRFKKLCEKEGLIKDIRRHEAHEKPSIRRRRDAMKRLKNIERFNKELQGSF